MTRTDDFDISRQLAETVKQAAAQRLPLAIRGSGSKRFLTGEPAGTPLDAAGHRGIVAYEPTELVLTARAGTPLAEIEALLAQHNQMLGFEPPYFGEAATLGGTIACNLSGPRRPYAGAARDFVLGITILNGTGEVLHFGGRVMKNVAGYDIARLMVGSLGTLGVILAVSLKVLPKPACELTLGFELGAAEALAYLMRWGREPLPLSAACHFSGTLYVRLSGTDKGVQAAAGRLGGERVPGGDALWRDLREQQLPFFRDHRPLWRLSLPPASAPLDLPGGWLIDWGGAQRWLTSDAPAVAVREAARRQGGYAVPFRNGPQDTATATFALLDPALRALQARLQRAFDPCGIFGTGWSLEAAALSPPLRSAQSAPMR
jgi:glycolate oxidase FAD binding subunit